jgi:hypothetical protein
MGRGTDVHNPADPAYKNKDGLLAVFGQDYNLNP